MASNPLKHLTRRRIGGKDVLSAMLAAPLNEDDRSVAISACALVEFSLEKALKLRLRRMTKVEQESLFDGNAPLATFSAKIKMGYALGIYGKEMRHDLETVNRIRNVFAHSVQEVTFKNRRIVNAIYGMHVIKPLEGKRGSRLVLARSNFLGATRIFHLLLVTLAGPRLPMPPPFAGFVRLTRTQRRRARSIDS
jgi:hypothetical protein